MKLFDGIHENTYETVFGNIQIYLGDDGFQFQQFDTPSIHMMQIKTLGIIHQMRFDTFDEAHEKLKTMHRVAASDLRHLLYDIGEN